MLGIGAARPGAASRGLPLLPSVVRPRHRRTPRDGADLLPYHPCAGRFRWRPSHPRRLGDPRQLFIRLAAGLVEESVARGDVGYFDETGLGSEAFGAQPEVPDRYGASFAIDQDRILGPVDP